MPAGNVGYSDTRTYTGGTLYPKIYRFIKNKIRGAAEDARNEKGAAKVAMGVGSRNDGVTQQEFDKEKDGYTSVKHQREVGTSYFDAVSNTISGGSSSTTAMEGSTETEQF